MMNQWLPLFTSVALVTFSAGSASALSLIGSELKVGLELQRTPTSELLESSFPVSAIVSESVVEFPNAQSLFGSFPGFSIVNVAIDAGADYLKLDYPNAGFGVFANTFKNSYVFTFTKPIALQITDVTIDPSTTLALTPERITFEDEKLFVNVAGLFFNSNSSVRLNLTTVAVDPETPIVPDPAAVPEPSSMLLLGSATGVGALFKRYKSRRANQA